eukprot:gene40175-48956_t
MSTYTSISTSKIYKLAKLTATSIAPDLLCFTPLEATGLIIFAASSIVFSFIDFNHLTDPENNPSIYNTVNDREAGIEKWRRILMCLSGGAAFTGVLSVVLTTKGKLTAFFWGMINSLLYGLFAYAYGYAGDAQLNLFFFLPVQLWGIWSWGEQMLEGQNSEGSDSNELTENVSNTVQSRQLNLWQWLVCLVLAGGISVGFYYEIPEFAIAISGVYYFEGKEVPRTLDSVVNALSMIGQMLSIWRYNEQWYFWLSVDVLQIAMFTGVAGYGIVINVLVMWILFTLNALSGLYAWQMRYYYPETATSHAEDERKDAKYQQIIDVENDVVVDIHDAHCTTCRDPSAHGNGSEGFTSPLAPLRVSGNTQKPKRGLIIGKFWPFHRGHQYLVETAVATCQEVYVIACDRPYFLPSGQMAQEAIRETCPSVFTMVVRDVYDPVDSQLWAQLAVAWCGFVPDRVFTSEPYGEAFAKFLGAPCVHVLVDMARSQFPVSGTAVRADPRKHWAMLPPATRRFYCKRIVLVGAESTGKTTLAQQLAKHFGDVPCVLEYARELCEQQLALRNTASIHSKENQQVEEFSFTDEDFEHIALEQCRRENQAAMTSDRGLIACDTDAWATLRWFSRYQRKPPTARLLALQREHASRIAPDGVIYVLC